eukprot:CAMPEP_0174748974 /NCGR_PEP_ID=MMETSP1094-20130205/94679_1 /TAXON_ID=156173 /ORGANISM="Chrysochromulina brevifilum, Strain UTEX LB 985" /LENGTH=36 /DNA_ID= /DNA_START= /DNA_END= /DNA_ORIENTATION=
MSSNGELSQYVDQPGRWLGGAGGIRVSRIHEKLTCN